MAHRILAAALGMVVATSPVSASNPEPTPTAAPSAGADARYCLRVEPLTGSLVGTIQCWTRAEWADQGVDVDKEWAKEGVEVLS